MKKKDIVSILLGVTILGGLFGFVINHFLERPPREVLSTTLGGPTLVFPYQGGTGTSTVPTAGQILIGTSGGVYNVNTITASSGISIVTSSGGITISSTGGSGTVTGNSTSTYLAFWSASSTLTGNAGLTFDSTTGVLDIPSSTISRLTFTNATGTTLTLSGIFKASSTVTIQGATDLRGELTFISATGTAIGLSGAINGSSTLTIQGATALRTTLAVTQTSTLAALATTNVSSSGNVNITGYLVDGQGNKYSTSTAAGGGGSAGVTCTLDSSNAVLPNTNFAAVNKAVLSNVIYQSLDFDASTSESAQFKCAIPTALGTIATSTATINWTASSTATGTVTFNFSYSSLPDITEIDDAFEASATSSDTYATTTSNAVHSVILQLTTSTVMSAGDTLFLKVSRNVSDDDLAVDARLLEIKLRIQ